MQKMRLGASEPWVENGVVYIRNVDKNATHTLDAARESTTVKRPILGSKRASLPMKLFDTEQRAMERLSQYRVA